MTTMAGLVSQGKLGTVAGEPQWLLGVALHNQLSTVELHSVQRRIPLWHVVLSSLTRSHVETRQQIHFHSLTVSESPRIVNPRHQMTVRRQDTYLVWKCQWQANSEEKARPVGELAWRGGREVPPDDVQHTTVAFFHLSRSLSANTS